MDGLECLAVQAMGQRIIPVLKKWFKSQLRQNKKIIIIVKFLKTGVLCAMELEEARSVGRFSRQTLLGQHPCIFKSK